MLDFNTAAAILDASDKQNIPGVGYKLSFSLHHTVRPFGVRDVGYITATCYRIQQKLFTRGCDGKLKQVNELDHTYYCCDDCYRRLNDTDT